MSVEVFFDGECPLCMREINLLRRLDRERGRIRFTDIAAPEFRPEDYGRDMATFMGSIQGRDAQGHWIEGVDVFRALYAAVGFERLVGISKWALVDRVLRAGYRVFARYRLRLTGRTPECTDRCGLPSES